MAKVKRLALFLGAVSMARKVTKASRSSDGSKAGKAKAYAKDPSRVLELVKEAAEKAKTLTVNKGPLNKVWEWQKVMLRMVQAYVRREYTYVPKDTMMLAILAIVYFVSPIDILPDLIPGLGHLDDAAVIAFVLTSIREDLERFQKWEERRLSRGAKTTTARMKDASAN